MEEAVRLSSDRKISLRDSFRRMDFIRAWVYCTKGPVNPWKVDGFIGIKNHSFFGIHPEKKKLQRAEADRYRRDPFFHHL